MMEATAKTRNARISANKAREVSRLIQGKSYDEALKLVTFANKKAAGIIKKTLVSAKANAVNNHQAVEEDLFVKLAVIGEGPTMKRFRPKARGMAGRINKRTSHVTIVLTDEI
jgi:large subunit ribosomal protein L22